jgi:hypothetical protein
MSDAMGERRRYEIRSILAMSYTVGYFGIIFLSFFAPFPDENAKTIETLLVLLGTVQAAIISYYFGSSRDVQQKAAAAERAEGQ